PVRPAIAALATRAITGGSIAQAPDGEARHHDKQDRQGQLHAPTNVRARSRICGSSAAGHGLHRPRRVANDSYRCFCSSASSLLRGMAPTSWPTTLPPLKISSVGIDLTPYI